VVYDGQPRLYLYQLVDADYPTTPRERIAAQVRAQITAGRLCAGDELPSVRHLTRDLRVAPNTIVRGYSELERDGWVKAEPRQGVLVAGVTLAPEIEERRRLLSEELARLLLAAVRLGSSAAEVHAELDRQLRADPALDV
jgi:GntR family transcriptional regulator